MPQRMRSWGDLKLCLITKVSQEKKPHCECEYFPHWPCQTCLVWLFDLPGQHRYHLSPQPSCYLPFRNSSQESMQPFCPERSSLASWLLCYSLSQVGGQSKGLSHICFQGSSLSYELFPWASPVAGEDSKVFLCSLASRAPEQAFLTHWNLSPSSFSAGFQNWEKGQNLWLTQALGMTKEWV